MNFYKRRLNFKELIESWYPEIDCDFISYNPKLNKSNSDYEIIRCETTDGTLLFQQGILEELSCLLLNRQSYYKYRSPIKLGQRFDVQYEIGDLKISTVYGNFDINGNIIFGERVRYRLPVKYFVNYTESGLFELTGGIS